MGKSRKSSKVVFAVTGPRSWENEVVVDRMLARLGGRFGVGRLVMIAGGAPGLDSIAESKAKERGIHVARVDALWDVYHRGAGPIRNGVVLDLEPRFVVAFYWDLGEHKGTTDMVRQAKQRGTKLLRIKVDRDVGMPQTKRRGGDERVGSVRSRMKMKGAVIK